MQRKKIRNLQVARKRLKDRIWNLNSLLSYLQEKYGVTESAASIIKASLPDSTAGELFTRILKGRSTKKFSPELRAFAITLNFYSTRAYNYVRETFNHALPHVATITKWFRTIDGGPGFTKQSWDAIKMKVSENDLNNKKTLCNLVMDEMAIMKQVQWTGKKFTGYVDIGTGVDSDEIPGAKEAIVFMVVCVNGHWKIPVGYFFIDGLNGTEKANIVKKLLEFLDETGIIITSLTFDGIPSNISMATTLGADSDTSNLRTYFFHPKRIHQKIHIFLDIPHMLKLVRNCLASQQILTNGNGDQILWRYFQNLVDFEYDHGLKAGTKIRKRHIEWFREKMKVSLASQTLSKSTADAFRYLRDDIHLEQFKDVEATAVFTETFNNLFDIFNVHTIHSKYIYKRALNPGTKEFIFNFLNECKNYIQEIKLNGIPVRSTRRKTGFLGFLIAINTIQNIYEEYIVSKVLDFVLTYKFSQDHLEIFFSAIRSRGGNNNNPTAFQFEHIYKRLLIHSQVKGSEHANVTAIDFMRILYCSSTLSNDENGRNLLNTPEYTNISEQINEMDFLSSPVWHLTVKMLLHI
ncbi:unnamed protein product [Callosobruchus maculatus]|uniref:THAP domain-containing protein 9 n=1 Tax=Callosobruchus maculatus TaxID=64391 RepID=A0A653D697_CALMS|nr:unnamed protein product [Callosobruchus maculatus]